MTREETWLLEEKYRGQKTEGFLADCERLRAGEPLAYVIGHVPFHNLTIHLDSRPLIPRTETEYWTGEILAHMRKAGKMLKVLDLCAGSGCIGVAVRREIEGAHVDFCEIDARHHATILKNLTENSIDPKRSRIFGGDLFEQVRDTYDYILTNPPYIDQTLNRTEESVRAFEPEDALYGGDKGMEIIARIIREAPKYLQNQGLLVIEHEPEQSGAIRTLSDESGFIPTTRADQYGTERYTILTRKAS